MPEVDIGCILREGVACLVACVLLAQAYQHHFRGVDTHQRSIESEGCLPAGLHLLSVERHLKWVGLGGWSVLLTIFLGLLASLLLLFARLLVGLGLNIFPEESEFCGVGNKVSHRVGFQVDKFAFECVGKQFGGGVEPHFESVATLGHSFPHIVLLAEVVEAERENLWLGCAELKADALLLGAE